MFDSASVPSGSLMGMILPLFKGKGLKACEKDNYRAYNIQSAFLGEFKHRLGKREISEGLQDYENIRNLVCHLRLNTCLGKMSPDFTMQELSKAISELKKWKVCRSTWFDQRNFQKRWE